MLSRPATRTRSRGKGCLLRSLIALGLLLILFTAAWFFALRPALRSLAENQIGEVLTSGMAEINPVTTALVPAGIPLPVPESLISDALVMPSSSWFTIQNMQLNITPEAINVSFSVQVALFTFTCTVTTVPQIVNGQPVVSTLTTTGPVSLVISSGEIKAEVNSYLSQIRGRIQRPIAALTLENHFLLVTLGPVTGS